MKTGKSFLKIMSAVHEKLQFAITNILLLLSKICLSFALDELFDNKYS